jgi:uncharacterized protein
LEYLIIIVASALTALLTFFSGFGLGTILTPVFALFFPIDLAIALTGVVHFFNNLFKLVLVGKHANLKVVLKFGIPAIAAAFVGAWLLLGLSELKSIFSYSISGHPFEISPVKFAIALILIVFVSAEQIKIFNNLNLSRLTLPVGGILSGFFGGLSGIQGAFRSAILIKAGLSKEIFIGTSVAIASLVDITRLSVYASRYGTTGLGENLGLVISATLAAMAGAFIGNYLLKKTKLKHLQTLVAIMLILISVALGAGII